MGTLGDVKTTIDVHDELLKRAKRHAKETGQTLRAVIEEGLRMVLEKPPPTGYKLPDLRVGDPDGPNPFEKFTFAEMLEMSERELSMFPDAADEESAQGASWR